MKAITELIWPQNGVQLAQRYIDTAKIAEYDKAILRDYLTSLIAGDGKKKLSPQTIRQAIFSAKFFAERTNKSFRDVVKQDILNFKASLIGQGRKDSTAGNYAIRLRHFFIWLDGGLTDKVSWIRKVKTMRNLQESDLVTPSEIKKMISVCPVVRDRALISVLYDSACRISELLNAKIKDVIFDDYGAKIKVTGKTGTRTIRLIDSVLYLSEWINNHPYKTNNDAFLFINFSSNRYGTPLFMGTAGIKLRTYAERAKLHKYVYPHLLRHSRLTWLAQKENFNERDLCIFAGWVNSSDMPETYLHYGEAEVDIKLRKAKGLQTEKESITDVQERKSLEPKICPRCKVLFPKNPEKWKQPATALYCNCGMGLDIKILQEEIVKRETGDDVLNTIVNDPEMSKVFAELVRKAQRL